MFKLGRDEYLSVDYSEIYLLPSGFWWIGAVLSLIKSDNSAILESIVCSCALLSPDAEGMGVSLMMVFGTGEVSVLVDVRLVITAWNMRDARQITPKPTKTCCRAAGRFVETWVVGAFKFDIFTGTEAWTRVRYLFVEDFKKK